MWLINVHKIICSFPWNVRQRFGRHNNIQNQMLFNETNAHADHDDDGGRSSVLPCNSAGHLNKTTIHFVVLLNPKIRQ